MVAFELLGQPKSNTERFRVTRRESARVARLALRLGKSKSEAINMAIAHALGTLESADPRMWTTVPGEAQVDVEEDTA